MFWFLCTLTAAMVGIHMTRPFFEKHRLSAARFFKDLPPAKEGKLRLRPGNPFTSRIFYVRVLIPAFILAAVGLPHFHNSSEETQERLALWIVVDTSASMSTMQNGLHRMEAAKAEIRDIISTAKEKSKSGEISIRLSSFDLIRRDIMPLSSPDKIEKAIPRLNYRPLGTNLNLIGSLKHLSDENNRAGQEITHLVVISDMPAPEWVEESNGSQIIWRDIGSPVSNLGLTDIRTKRSPLTGLTQYVNITVKAYGPSPSPARLLVTAPDGTIALESMVNMEKPGSWHGRFSPTSPGRYHLALSPGGAYGFDDKATIEIPQFKSVRVDWQVNKKELPRRLGWEISQMGPQIRVLSGDTADGSIPSLLIGPGYRQARKSGSEIRFFKEKSPLIADLNFDVLESLNLDGRTLPKGFNPVLDISDKQTLIAVRQEPPAVYIPGLPTKKNDNLDNVSATVFFNAVQWLTHKKPLPPPYTLTTPEEPLVEGTRLALHNNEGNTASVPRSTGDLNALAPVRGKGEAKPIWPVLVMAASLLFAIERLLSTYGGSKWR